MNRISVTTLESFRRFIHEVSSFDTEEKLMQSIKGEFIGNAKTFYGTGFHAIIEGDYIKNKTGNIIAADIEFTPEQAAPAFEYAKAHPLMVHEMNLSEIYESKYGPIQIGGRVDGIEGISIRDIKTKYRAPKVDEYMDSFQWRYYLDIMQMDLFYFDLFEVKKFSEFDITHLGDKEGKDKQPVLVQDAVIVPYPEIPCQSYDSMHTDCLQLLNDFLDWVDFRNMMNYLKPAKEIELFPFS